MTEEILHLPTRQASRSRRAAGSRPSPLDRLARRAVHGRLAGLRAGSLELIEDGERTRFGDARSPLRATIVVEDPRVYRALALGGALGGSEAYLDGYWRSDDLTAVIRLLAADRAATSGLDSLASGWRRPFLRMQNALRRNSRAGSRRNIAAHYDLGNEFFALFLDPTLTYSCGFFEHAGASMEEASVAKYERVCRKLAIGADDHVLEIGTGWGGFALHAAAQHGCRVTTTTLSRRQHEQATERVRAAGLEDRIEVRLQDYRDLDGRYDKLVSIEMIEAVGSANLETFFRVCAERLRDDGAMLIQAITIPDRDFAAHTRSVDFIKRHIFPGGELVSLSAIGAAIARTSGLRWAHLEDLTPHYAETLRRWRRRMQANRQAIRALGLDERFLRAWDFYLSYCEGGFEERAIGLVQVVFEGSAARRGAIPAELRCESSPLRRMSI